VAATGILDQIGNTSLVRLQRIPPEGAEIWVKLEYRNPTGSMKDRMALAMIEGAERDGLLEPGTTVVEYTGGSTGPALAFVCRAKGYAAKIVISECFSEERILLTRALGAELELLPAVEERGRVTTQDIENMIERAAELAREPARTRPTSSTIRTPSRATGRRSAGRSGSRQTGGLRRSSRGSARRARCSEWVRR
jgi:cysteine synthase